MKHLPKIDDPIFDRQIARMQFNEDAKAFFEWLFGDAYQSMVLSMINTETDKDRQIKGALQLLEDLKNLLAQARQRARDSSKL